MLSSFSLFPSRSFYPDYLVAACTNVVFPLGTIIVLLYCIVLYLYCIVLVLYCTCTVLYLYCIVLVLVLEPVLVLYSTQLQLVQTLSVHWEQLSSGHYLLITIRRPRKKTLHILWQKDASQTFFVLRIFTSLLEVHLYQMKPSY